MWLVSGTPISTSLDQLKKQAELLRLRNGFEDIHQRWVSNEEVVSWLRTHMIRHTKAMRIGGEVALALPEADCQTVRHAASCSLGSVLFPCLLVVLLAPRARLRGRFFERDRREEGRQRPFRGSGGARRRFAVARGRQPRRAHRHRQRRVRPSARGFPPGAECPPHRGERRRS